jgi:hypothetical protein
VDNDGGAFANEVLSFPIVRLRKAHRIVRELVAGRVKEIRVGQLTPSSTERNFASSKSSKLRAADTGGQLASQQACYHLVTLLTSTLISETGRLICHKG